MRDVLEEWIGVKLLIAIFGFAGGLISLSVSGAKTPLLAIGSVFSGLFCAVAFTPIVHSLWGYPDTFQNGISFILGISGMTVVRFIHEKITSRSISERLAERTKLPDINLPPVDAPDSKK